jgi:hypothetical protein
MLLEELLGESFVVLKPNFDSPKGEGASAFLSRSGNRWKVVRVEGDSVILQNRKGGTINVKKQGDEHFKIYANSTDFEPMEF